MSAETLPMLVSSQKSSLLASCFERISVSSSWCGKMSPSSFTVISRVAKVAPDAEAVISKVLFPSGKISSTAVMAKFADAWPDGIVTVAGTVASVVSVEFSVTSRAPVVAPERVTVPVEAGLEALSENDAGDAPTVSVTEGGATPKPL